MRDICAFAQIYGVTRLHPRISRQFSYAIPDNPALFIEFIVGMSIALIRSWSTKTAVRRIVEAIEAETLGTSFKRSRRGKPPH
jgi:hypothetical protein